MVEIVVADLVPLSQRGPYWGLVAAQWAFASAIGPSIGGAVSQSNWRWLFYMNLPVIAIAMVLVWFFLRLKTPQDDLHTKMRRMDWIGNGLSILGTTITLVALTWAGVKYPWASYQVLLPLALGSLLTAAFFIYEAKLAIEPVVPWELVSNRTAFFSYLGVFLQNLVVIAINCEPYACQISNAKTSLTRLNGLESIFPCTSRHLSYKVLFARVSVFLLTRSSPL